jgi:hypothetical protein
LAFWINTVEKVCQPLRLRPLSILVRLQTHGITRLRIELGLLRSGVTILTLTKVSQLLLFYNTDMVQELEAGCRVEIISILLFSLCSIEWLTRRGRRLLSCEYDD